ncbi:MAG: hypothetical protein LRY69_04235 [Gammaproteobacteria bacterium]|nr:hypothetical protein [Gammaproteobacteria bacterium]
MADNVLMTPQPYPQQRHQHIYPYTQGKKHVQAQLPARDFSSTFHPLAMSLWLLSFTFNH